MAKFSKRDPGTLPHLEQSSLQRLITVKSCIGLHLMCDKVLRSVPDFYVSHHCMPYISTLNINMKNKQVAKQMCSIKTLASVVNLLYHTINKNHIVKITM